MEQEEYTREGIEWSFVSFPDNQDCIDLIELKGRSIFSTLDDECKLAGGSDVKFASRMISELGEYSRFSVTPAQKTLHQFCISHYAGEVVYSTATFVEKNRDELPKEATDLMGLSSTPLLRYIFSPENAAASGSETAVAKKQEGRSTLGSPTICTQFKLQLASLLTKIHGTKPHYIRCLKPNDLNKPDTLNRIRTTEQLRYGGVLEAVRVARSGFPVRLSHEDFYTRYRPLANPFSPLTQKMPRHLPPSTLSNKAEAIKACTTLLELMWDSSIPTPAAKDKNAHQTLRRVAKAQFWFGAAHKVNTNSIQLGKTKVFFRKQAHDLFEGRRSRNQVVHVRSMQSGIRGWLARIWFQQAKQSVLRLQIAIRYFLFHRRFLKKRRLNAALRIQTGFRRHLHFRRFRGLLSAVLSVQKCFRGKVARRAVTAMLRDRQATRLQARMRALSARYKYRKLICAIVALQCRLRCKRSKVVLRDRRAAARDVGKLKQNNEAMKQEIERLRAEAAQATALSKLQAKQEEEARLKESMAKASESLEEVKRQLDAERKLRAELEKKLATTESALSSKSLAVQQGEESRVRLEQQVNALEMQLKDMERAPPKPSGAKSPRSPSAKTFVPQTSQDRPISEEKMAEILNGYISIEEHDRLLKAAEEESALLRRTISRSTDAQQVLLKEFQRRRSVVDEPKVELPSSPTARGILKSMSVSRKLSREMSTTKHVGFGAEKVALPSMSADLNSEGKDEKFTKPALLKTESSKKKMDADHGDLLRKMSGLPATPQLSRARSVDATELMKILKTPEGIAHLKNEMGNLNLNTSLTPPPEGTELGFRPSPHPDVKPQRAKSQLGLQLSQDFDALGAKKIFDQNLESFKTRLSAGFPVQVYTVGIPSTDCIMQLEKPALLIFTPPPR